MKRTIQVDLGFGLVTIEVDQRMFQQLHALALVETLKRAQEKAQESARAFRDATFTFSAGGPTGQRSFFDWTGAYPGQAWIDEEHWQRAEEVHVEEPARPAIPRTTTEAIAVLEHYLPGDLFAADNRGLRGALRRAKRVTHPDTGGTAADFQLVTAAEEILRGARRI